MSKVLIADPLPNQVYSPTFRREGIDFIDNVPASDLEQRISDCEVLIVRSATRVTEQLLSKAPRLGLIMRAGVGYDNVDLEAATSYGMIVANTPDASSRSVAQHTMALIHNLSNSIISADSAMKDGKWEKRNYTGQELDGKLLGIVGLGRIGSRVAQAAKAMGMRIGVYDPGLSRDQIRNLGYEVFTLDDLLRYCDYLTLHAPFIDKPQEQGGNLNMIDARALSLMKCSAKLINTARGELLDENALYEAIANGRLAGAALDVFKIEPYEGRLRELGHKVILTPHVAGQAAEAQERIAFEVVQYVVAFLKTGEYPPTTVNINPFSKEIRPYLDLAQRMGLFVRQLEEGPISEMEIKCYGGLVDMDRRGLSAAALVGLMHDQVEHVSLVNARSLAEQRRIKYSEMTSREATEYRNMLSLEVMINGRSVVIQGNLYEDRNPRVIGLNGYPTLFEPSGIILVSSHKDVPGVLAHVTGTLGNSGINIAQFYLSRKKPGGDAIAVINVDDPVPDSVLRQIANPRNHVYSVRQIVIPEKLSPTL